MAPALDDPVFRPLETLVHPGLLGLRFWDVAAGDFVRDGLRVQTRDELDRPIEAILNRSGVWSFPRLPGIRAVDVARQLATAPESPPAGRPFVIEVLDTLRRYLPVTFEVLAPVAGGLFDWLPGDFSAPPGSPPGVQPNPVPLFSSPARPAPPGRKVVYAGLREFLPPSPPDRPAVDPAAWALLEIEVDGVDGPESHFGLADDHGHVAVFVPTPPVPADGSRIPLARRSWSVRPRAYYAPTITSSGSVPESDPRRASPPRLDAILAQRSAGPAPLFSSILPLSNLTEEILHFAEALVLRTADAGLLPEERSFLFTQPVP
jgi:hypothetical protein